MANFQVVSNLGGEGSGGERVCRSFEQFEEALRYANSLQRCNPNRTYHVLDEHSDRYWRVDGREMV